MTTRTLQRVIPSIPASDGAGVKLLRSLGATAGPVQGLSTEARYFDIHLEPRAVFEAPLPAGHNAFLYAYEGDAAVGEDRKPLAHRAAGLLSDGDAVRIEALEQGARVLLLSGKPIREPMVQYGPFVMNTREQIEQAIDDYQSGAFAKEKVQRIRMANG